MSGLTGQQAEKLLADLLKANNTLIEQDSPDEAAGLRMATGLLRQALGDSNWPSASWNSKPNETNSKPSSVGSGNGWNGNGRVLVSDSPWTIEAITKIRDAIWATRDGCLDHYPRRCPHDCPNAGHHSDELAQQGLCECRRCAEKLSTQEWDDGLTCRRCGERFDFSDGKEPIGICRDCAAIEHSSTAGDPPAVTEG